MSNCILTTNLRCRIKGDTSRSIKFTYSENSIPIDLTGATIKIEFKRSSNFGRIVKTAIIGDGVTVTNAVGGVFEKDEFICNLDSADYYIVPTVTFSDGDIKTFVNAKMSVINF